LLNLNISYGVRFSGARSVRFYTKQKSVMQRWPASIAKGAEFVMPTAK
jgi:malonate-semialdehyde dehydrogenase (acetylating)/methylmalonate-semialdehyde dehydrogenase